MWRRERHFFSHRYLIRGGANFFLYSQIFDSCGGGSGSSSNRSNRIIHRMRINMCGNHAWETGFQDFYGRPHKIRRVVVYCEEQQLQ